jgi:hypothetical protein
MDLLQTDRWLSTLLFDEKPAKEGEEDEESDSALN